VAARSSPWFCPSGSDGTKQQRPQLADAEEKKSQISADSGLSVTSGSQVCSFGALECECAVVTLKCTSVTPPPVFGVAEE